MTVCACTVVSALQAQLKCITSSDHLCTIPACVMKSVIVVQVTLMCVFVCVCVDSNGFVQVWFCDDLFVRTIDACVDIWRINPCLLQSNKACVWC